jgi:ligand-binding sensor domain-containing protein
MYHDYLYSLAQEGDYIWAGSSMGLVKIDRLSDSITFYNVLNSGLPENWVYSIAIDSNNVKWVGNLSEGLTSFDGNQWITYNTNNSGLPDNKIKSYSH